MASKEALEKARNNDFVGEEEDIPDLESVGSSEYEAEETGNKPPDLPKNGAETVQQKSPAHEEILVGESIKGAFGTSGINPEGSKFRDTPLQELEKLKDSISSGNDSSGRVSYDSSYLAHWRYSYSSKCIVEPARRIKVQLLSPFLFGTFSVADKWIEWLYEAGLLPSKSEFNLEQLSDRELLAVETVERAANEASLFMDFVPRAEKENFEVLVECIDPYTSLSEVLKAVKDLHWFNSRLQNIVPPWHSDKSNPCEAFYIVAFVYAIAITVKKSKTWDSDLEPEGDQTVKEGEQCRMKGNSFYKKEAYRDAIESYTDAINMRPFVPESYGNRAIAHLRVREHRSSLSDSYRCIVLNPDGWKGYSRYACALHSLGKREKAECIYRELQTTFPALKTAIAQEWTRCTVVESVDEDAAKDKERREERLRRKTKKAEQQRKLNQKLEEIHQHLRKASLSLKQNDAVASREKYQLARQMIAEHRAKWNEKSGEAESSKLYGVILYCSAWAELGAGLVGGAESLLSGLAHSRSLAPPCHLLQARCHMAAHRYKDAERSLSNAQTQLHIYSRNFRALRWPGLEEEYLDHLRPASLERTIRRLREFCSPSRGSPDYICRYHGCDQNFSPLIYLEDKECKECVVLTCWDGCLLPYHQVCWKKQKDLLASSNDRDLLGRPCYTPDCVGMVTEIRTLDGLEVKYRMQSSERRRGGGRARVVKESRQPVSSEAHRIKILRKKHEALDRKSQEEKSKQQKPPGHQANPSSSSFPNPPSQPQSDLNHTPLGITQEVDSRSGSECLLREPEPEKRKEKGKRKEERGKRSRGSEELSNSSAVSELSSSLFTAAPIEPRNVISARDDIDISGNLIQADLHPAHKPLQVSAGMKRAHEDFERSYAAEHYPSGPSNFTSDPAHSRPFTEVVRSSPHSIPLQFNSMEEDLFEYFEGVVSEQGPLQARDDPLQQALRLLPEDQRLAVEQRGGLEAFLRLCPRVVEEEEGILCIREHSGIVRESLRMGRSRDSDSPSVTPPTVTPAFFVQTEESTPSDLATETTPSVQTEEPTSSDLITESTPSVQTKEPISSDLITESTPSVQTKEPVSSDLITESTPSVQSKEPVSSDLITESTPSVQSKEPISSDLTTESTPSVQTKEPTSSDLTTEPASSVQTKEPTSSDLTTEPTSSVLAKEPTSSVQITEPTSSVLTKKPTYLVQTKDLSSSVKITEPTSSVQTKEPTSSDLTKEPTSSVQITEPTSSVLTKEPTYFVQTEDLVSPVQTQDSPVKVNPMNQFSTTTTGAESRKVRAASEEEAGKAVQQLFAGSPAQKGIPPILGTLPPFRGVTKTLNDFTSAAATVVVSETEEVNLSDSLTPTTPPLEATPPLTTPSLLRNSFTLPKSIESGMASLNHLEEGPPLVAGKPVVLKDKYVQTTRVKRVDVGMVTDNHSVDNYKHMYENVCKERNKLSLKVRSLEEEKTKVKRSHQLEQDRSVKQAVSSALSTANDKLHSARLQHAEEVRRWERERREKQDQLLAARKEGKAVQDKLDKSRKEAFTAQEHSMEFSKERDHLLKARSSLEEQLQKAQSSDQRSKDRALQAELLVVQLRGDLVLRDVEGLWKEAVVVSDRTKLPAWRTYSEMLKSVLEETKATVAQQARAIQQGSEFSGLPKPSPALPPRPPPPPMINPVALMQARMLQAQAMKGQGQGGIGGGGVLTNAAVGRPPPLPADQPMGGVTPAAAGVLGGSYPYPGMMSSPVLPRKRGTQQIWETVSGDYPNLTQDGLKEVLREVKSEHNNSMNNLTTERIVAIVRSKLDSRAANQIIRPLASVATAPVFPSAFPSQSSHMGDRMTGGVIGSGLMGAGEVTGSSVGMATPASGSVFMPMSATESIWNPPPTQQSGQLISHGTPPGEIPSQLTGLAGQMQQSKLLQQPLSPPPSLGQGYPHSLGHLPLPSLATGSNQASLSVRSDPAPLLLGGGRRVAVAPPPRPRAGSHVVFGEEECVICAEDMQAKGRGVLKLDCGHRFHERCIRQWLAEQSTCPTCRHYVKLDEDFPELI